MSDVTRILSQIGSGDPSAAEQLLPLVYDELRKLATAKLAQEKPGQTLQATALVHDANLRLVDQKQVQGWNSRGHFFGAAAEAMRRILVESARRRMREIHGGRLHRISLFDDDVAVPPRDEELLALDEALEKLANVRPQAAELVKLRFFAGLAVDQPARRSRCRECYNSYMVGYRQRQRAKSLGKTLGDIQRSPNLSRTEALARSAIRRFGGLDRFTREWSYQYRTVERGSPTACNMVGALMSLYLAASAKRDRPKATKAPKPARKAHVDVGNGSDYDMSQYVTEEDIEWILTKMDELCRREASPGER